MNTPMTDNIQTTIDLTKAEYCRIKDFQIKLTADFADELAAINLTVSELGGMLDPISLINKLLSTTTSKIIEAQSEVSLKTTKYNQLLSDLNDKLNIQKAALQDWYNSLPPEEQAKLPHKPDGSFDMDSYCTTLPNSQKEW